MEDPKVALRALNLACERPTSAELKLRDASLKRCASYLKKLRVLTEDLRETLLAELDKLNLTKFIDEAAAAIAEAKLKLVDIPSAVQVCSYLHRTYAPFAPSLQALLLKTLSQPSDAAESDTERTSRLSRKRSTLKLLFELYAVGVFASAPPLLSALGELAKDDAAPSDPPHVHLGVLASFAKYAANDPLVLSMQARARLREILARFARDRPDAHARGAGTHRRRASSGVVIRRQQRQRRRRRTGCRLRAGRGGAATSRDARVL